ncbi:MAG: discoidin domain-containing protein [Planctomycetota bacterium]|nr:discoidin domain-containing protein [Planctomycetota bacterium]
MANLPAADAARALEVTISAKDRVEPGQRPSAQLVLTNSQAEPASCKVTFSWQTDSAMFSEAPPDPIYGRDRALGARSWTEADGRIIEEGSLTDGKDYTDAGTPYIDNHFTEAFQYVDLGKTRRITRVSYLSGDANHSYKLDVAVSLDGKAYTAVSDLQGFDTYKKWGTIVLPLRGTVEGRYIRLRYHKDSEKVTHFRMPCRLSVYDGTADEFWELPKVGQALGQGAVTVDLPSRSSATANLPLDRALSPGLYLVACRVECGAARQLAYQHVLVMPEPVKTVSAASRFGINAANGDWAPILRRLGVGWVRFENMKWPFVSAGPGQYRFDGSVKPWQVNHDAIFRGYSEAGLNVLPFLFMIPSHASSAPATVNENRRSFYPPKAVADFGEFCFQVAARYGAQKHPATALKTPDGKSGLNYLHIYEIWNEPNLTDPNWGAWVGTVSQYMEMFRAAAEAIRRADPAAKVTNAGYAGIQVKTVDQLVRHTYTDGKHPLDFVDILNVHFYSGRIAPEIATDDFNAHQSSDITAEQEFQRLIAWRDAHKPGLPVWLTETGYDSAGPFGTDERTQAARLPRVVMLALANRIDKVFVYRESGSKAEMHAASGLLRDDGSFKPSYSTYATLIRELDGLLGGAIKLPYSDKNVRLYLWRRGDAQLLTAWTIEGESNLAVNLGQATVTDAFGQRRSADLAKGIGLSIFPIYIRDISDPRALQAMEAQARREETVRQEARGRLAQAQGYLYKFGGGAEGITMDIGRERPFMPVLASEVYSDGKGYGFFPRAAELQQRNWMPNELDRAACKLDKNQEFRFRLKPGRYHLRLGVSPYDNARVSLKGSAGGPQSLPATKGDSTVETTIEATDAVLSISIDNYALLRWLTVIEQVPTR